LPAAFASSGCLLAYTLLVFAHLLAASIALGAVVATDLRLLSRLARERFRIAPPNAFIARMVAVALLLLWVTGAVMVWHGALEQADSLSDPKLHAKLLLVALLTLNAIALHRISFPRLARGRRVARWPATDWAFVAVPLALSDFLWMFVAFLGVARGWDRATSLPGVLGIAAVLYVVFQTGVFAVLALTARQAGRPRWANGLLRALAAVGSLGVAVAEPEPEQARVSTQRRHLLPAANASDLPPPSSMLLTDSPPLMIDKPALRVVDTRATRRYVR
jgi:hypothetical protein